MSPVQCLPRMLLVLWSYAHQAGIECLQILPNQVKAACWVKAGEAKVGRQFANKILSAEIKNDHEADACAAAIAVLLAQKEKHV